ncbi:hypothetical protein [Tritonibacter mobilis]|uniref:hypothetical protein n=1 Tax=Tritonibacter mobilis TaxID=379347 RepID=UPI000806D4E9|nr:hypothetical protein [Tritonibacter mobilis]
MKKTVIGGKSRDDDWVICFNRHEVGRVMLDRFPNNGAAPWEWSAWCYPSGQGRVHSMEVARENVRATVLRATKIITKRG